MTKPPAARPVVFIGPTIAAEDAERILPATFLPPAAQGAFITAVGNHNPPAILLIDGVFQGEPAVRHKEILWTMARGIPVFGAASMGALRAAELSPHGMVGVGLIFRWYRRFALTPDDAVAVLHGPSELGSRALSHSLVDLRRTLRRAERVGQLDRAMRRRLERLATAMNFRDRTVANLIDRAMADGLDRTGLAAMRETLARDFVAQKKIDAISALRLLARLGSTRMLAQRPTQDFVLTTAFLRDLREAGIDPA